MQASCGAAAARLVCWSRSSWQLGAGVVDPHTKRRISRRPFSTCRPSWPTPEAKYATLTCVSGCRWTAHQPSQPTSQTSMSTTSELGRRPGQVRHDGAVHDGQAPAPASSSNGACDRPSLLLPHVQHMEGVQQARDEQLTSSSSSAAVGETAARLAIEPRSPHGRHGERERRDQLLRPAASRRVLTCYVSLRAKIETDVALGLIEVGYEEAGRASTVPVAALACAARQAARAGAPPPAAPP